MNKSCAQYKFTGTAEAIISYLRANYSEKKVGSVYGIGFVNYFWKGERRAAINFTTVEARFKMYLKPGMVLTDFEFAKIFSEGYPFKYNYAEDIIKESGQFDEV